MNRSDKISLVARKAVTDFYTFKANNFYENPNKTSKIPYKKFFDEVSESF